MKKAVKTAAVVIICLWTIMATFLFLIARDSNNEKYEQIQQMEAEIQKLKDESDGTDITTIRGLAYELLFDLVYHAGILGEEYDLSGKIDAAVEQYNLSEMEESELIVMIDVLITKYQLDK